MHLEGKKSGRKEPKKFRAAIKFMKNSVAS